MNTQKFFIILIVSICTALIAGCGDSGPNIPDPEITGIQPDSGPPGTVVTISGKGFSPEESENRVTFGGVEAPVNSASESQIEATVPEGAQTGPVAVTVRGKTTTGPNFTVEPKAPVINSIQPERGPVGTQVTISGMNFSPVVSKNTVTFDGVKSAVTDASETELITEVPAGATSGRVEVTVNGKTAFGPTFEVVTTGTLEIKVSTSGQDSDVDGYTFTVDSENDLSSAIDDTIYVTDLEPGVHQANMHGISLNCALNGNRERNFTITAGDTALVAFKVNCSAISVLRNKIVYTKLTLNSEGELTYDLHVMNPDGSRESRIKITPDKDEYFPDLSPDGTKIVFIIGPSSPDSDGIVYGDLAVINTDGTGFKKLTKGSDNGSNAQPRWSPDGSKIIFQRYQGSEGIFIMNADGSGQERVTTFNETKELFPEWSPDGSLIYFISNRDGDQEIYTMKPDGTDITQLTHNTGYETDAAPSPDGSRVAFISNRNGTDNLYVLNNGGNIEQLTFFSTGSVRHPTWSPDGSHIAFQYFVPVDFFSTTKVYSIRSTGGEPIRLTKANSSLHPSWSPVE